MFGGMFIEIRPSLSPEPEQEKRISLVGLLTVWKGGGVRQHTFAGLPSRCLFTHLFLTSVKIALGFIFFSSKHNKLTVARYVSNK